MKKPSKRIIETLQTFPRNIILSAYKEHIIGHGGNTVGQHYSPWHWPTTSHRDLTVIGDRLIDAGEWICENEGLDIHEVYCPDMVYFADYTITFHGSWGEIEVFPDTGEVIKVNADENMGTYLGTESFGGYHHIARVDMEEFKKWLAKYPTEDGQGHRINRYFSWDILDVGFWTIYGEYEPADEHHRKLMLEMQEVHLRELEDVKSL